jgi:hypothetical protein
MTCKCGCGAITPIAKRNRKELGHIKGKHIAYLLGHKMRGVTGKNHFNYKNGVVGYSTYHLRVQAARGKAKICKTCGSTQFVEWANLTGQYENIYDYDQLCRKCHHAFDDIANTGWQTRRGGDVTA